MRLATREEIDGVLVQIGAFLDEVFTAFHTDSYVGGTAETIEVSTRLVISNDVPLSIEFSLSAQFLMTDAPTEAELRSTVSKIDTTNLLAFLHIAQPPDSMFRETQEVVTSVPTSPSGESK